MAEAGSYSEPNFSMASATTSKLVGSALDGNSFNVDIIPESPSMVKSSSGSSSMELNGLDSKEYLSALLLPLSESMA